PCNGHFVHLGSQHRRYWIRKDEHMTDTIERPYSRDDVRRLRGSVRVEHTLARLGAERLRTLLEEREWVAALGAMTGGQAGQMGGAGPPAASLPGRAGR